LALARIAPKFALYYDLVRVPHGHLPAPRLRLWGRLPLPIRQTRDSNFYRCPECGEPSFFKIDGWCEECNQIMEDCGLEPSRKFYARVVRRKRRTYFRRFLKQIELLFLPLLVVLGKAWYVRSQRLHVRDFNRVGPDEEALYRLLYFATTGGER